MPIRRWVLIATLIGLVIILSPIAVMWAMMPPRLEILPPITPDSPIGKVLHAGRDAAWERDYPRAIEIYTAYLASQIKPNWYTSVVLRERSELYEKLQQYDRAEADLTAAIKSYQFGYTVYAERGAFYGRRQRDAEALADFQTGAKLDPKSGRYAYTEAQLREERRDYAGAIERMNEAIRIEPNERKYYLERGSAHNYAAMYAQAHADYDKASQIVDKHASARELARANFGRGYAALKLGLFQAAIDDFDVVLKAVPNASNALAYQGDAFEGIGDKERAIAAYKAALAIDPKQAKALEKLKALQPAQ